MTRQTPTPRQPSLTIRRLRVFVSVLPACFRLAWAVADCAARHDMESIRSGEAMAAFKMIIGEMA